MEVQRQCYFLRSDLLRMAMLSQRAVDYSIKAHELGASEVYRLFREYDQEWRYLQRRIGDRGRRLLASGMPVDADSAIAESALRIYSALYVTYTAASEITHIASVMAECEITTPSPRLGEIARFINSLVRLCTVALFNKEVRHVRGILHHDRNWRWCELALCRTRHLLMQNPSVHARSELAVARALGQIADQVCEVAEASTLWLEGDNRLGCTEEKTWLAA
jgi:phosphate uptake regulator